MACKRIDALLSVSAIFITFWIYQLKKRSAYVNQLYDIVNYESPPQCVDKRTEFARFNEFIAYVSFKCQMNESTSDARIICGQNLWLVPNLTSISITNDDNDFAFEDDMIVKSRSKNNRVRGATIKIGSKYGEENSFTRREFENTFFGNYRLSIDGSPVALVESLTDIFGEYNKVNILNIDTDSLNRSPENQILILEELLSSLKEKSLDFDQLYLTLNLKSSMDHSILYRWYLLLYQMYFKFDLALYSATQQGTCLFTAGAQTQNVRIESNCLYKISFRRYDPSIDIPPAAPIAGAGSPAEEFERLTTKLYNARILDVATDFNASMSKSCNLWYFATTDPLEIAPLTHCQQKIIVPKWSDESQKILWFDKENQGQTLHETLARIDEDVHFDNYLKTDLKGFEFEFFNEFWSTKHVKKFVEISTIFHLWPSEEHENYQRIYTHFVNFEKIGYLMRVHHNSELCDGALSKKFCYRIIWKRIRSNSEVFSGP